MGQLRSVDFVSSPVVCRGFVHVQSGFCEVTVNLEIFVRVFFS